VCQTYLAASTRQKKGARNFGQHDLVSLPTNSSRPEVAQKRLAEVG